MRPIGLGLSPAGADTAWGLPPPDEAVADPAYRAALAWLYRFSATPRTAAEIRADHPRKLARMRRLLERCGSPQWAYPAVLIAGTKGKGSTAAMLAAILRASGVRVGRYTQPHLVSYRERTWVDGQFIPPEAVIALARELRPLVATAARARPELGAYTTFEVGTALTLTYFARAAVDLAVVEVGVGGAHDATNVLDPVASVITPISADHLATIGPTLAEVAREKAGVLRAGRPAVIGPQESKVAQVLFGEAEHVGAPLVWVGRDWRWAPLADPAPASAFTLEGPGASYGSLTVPLLGRHQRDNAAAAVAAVRALDTVGIRSEPAAIAAGLAGVMWPGRAQVVPTIPTVVVDSAHNAASAATLDATLAECFSGRPITLVLGCTTDKDLAGMLDALAPRATRILATRARHDRAAPAESVGAAVAARGTSSLVMSDVPCALQEAMASTPRDGLVVVAGSVFIAGEALAYLGGRHGAVASL